MFVPEKEFDVYSSKRDSFRAGLEYGLKMQGYAQQVPCMGWGHNSTLDGVELLFSAAVGEVNKCGAPVGHGNWSAEYLWSLSLRFEFTHCKDVREFRQQYPTEYESYQKDLAMLTADQSNAIWLYHATGTSLRAAACSLVTDAGTGVCLACALLGQVRSIRKRVAYHLQQIARNNASIVPSAKVNYRHMSCKAAKDRLKVVRAQQQKDALSRTHLQAENVALKKRLAITFNAAIQGAESHDYPKFLRNLIDAHHISSQNGVSFGDGMLSAALEEILEGTSIVLKNGTRPGRALQPNEALFYAALLNTKGP